MDTAYLIIAYQDPEQLARLAARLTLTGDVYIHINGKVDIAPFLAAASAPRVYFAEDRVRVNWGGFSIVEATMKLIAMALERQEYARFVLLTGLDYPIRTDRELLDFYRENDGRSFLCAHAVDRQEIPHCGRKQWRDLYWLSRCVDLIQCFWPDMPLFRRDDHVVIGGRRCPLYATAPKWLLSGACARFLLDFYREREDVNRYFRNTHAPDDFYAATVLLNSPLADTVVTDRDLFLICWQPDDRGAKELREEDLPVLAADPALFAKKFTTAHSVELIRLLEEENRADPA